MEDTEHLRQVDQLLDRPRQMWLLGAGISKNAGIPLMYPLTQRVESQLAKKNQSDFQQLMKELPDGAHVEHALSHLGDLISLAERGKGGVAPLAGKECSAGELHELHGAILGVIREIVRFGYRPAENGHPEEAGTAEKAIISLDDHLSFVRALFLRRRANLEHRPPVPLFTTNYDTLLEDALAFEGLHFCDGFSRGAMAFWDPERREERFSAPFAPAGSLNAKLYKLHGSIDWYVREGKIAMRRREGAPYPKTENINLLIYPQAAKYAAVRREPFASLFAAFRGALHDRSEAALVVCGYSFGDEHINEEIERALRREGSQLTLLAFVKQSDREDSTRPQGLPSILATWLGDETAPWRKRVVVAGSRGIYRGCLKPEPPAADGQEYRWWSFQGLTQFLDAGPEGIR